jgi:hypothetical protein
MKDLNDNSTVEMFEAPKKRGRPSTGKAKSSAERQAAYRSRKNRGPEGGEVAINHWVTLSNKLALERLACHYRCSESDVLNKLISQADKAIHERFEYCSDEYNAYFDCVKK